MLSRLLITTVCVVMALMANKEVLAVPVKDVDACYAEAYAIYDELIATGCTPHDTFEDCTTRPLDALEDSPNPDEPVKDFKKDPTRVMDDLIIRLQKCGRTDFVTLCRVAPAGGFSECHTLTGITGLTKEECEKRRKEDYNSNNSDGSITTFKAAASKCVDANKFDCLKLC